MILKPRKQTNWWKTKCALTCSFQKVIMVLKFSGREKFGNSFYFKILGVIPGITYLMIFIKCLKWNLNTIFTICSFRNSQRQMSTGINYWSTGFEYALKTELNSFYLHYPSSFSCNLSNSSVNLCRSQMLYWSVCSYHYTFFGFIIWFLL